jgi:hypothetical protein
VLFALATFWEMFDSQFELANMPETDVSRMLIFEISLFGWLLH